MFGVHHVNETALRDEWIFWDIGFLLWGAAMLAGGRLPLRAGKRETSGGGAAAWGRLCIAEPRA